MCVARQIEPTSYLQLSDVNLKPSVISSLSKGGRVRRRHMGRKATRRARFCTATSHRRRLAIPRAEGVASRAPMKLLQHDRDRLRNWLRGDYDHWRQLSAVPAELRRCVAKHAEKNAAIHDKFHGADGPLHVETQPKPPSPRETFFAAVQSVVIPFSPDFEGAAQEGCGYYQATLKNGRRCSTARSLYRAYPRASKRSHGTRRRRDPPHCRARTGVRSGIRHEWAHDRAGRRRRRSHLRRRRDRYTASPNAVGVRAGCAPL